MKLTARAVLSAICLLLMAVALASCRPQVLESASRQDAPPAGRLPGNVVPLAYRVELTVTPERERFSGHVDITLDVREGLDAFWMHGQDLRVGEAGLFLADGTRVPVDYTQITDDGVVRIDLSRRIEPQQARLEISYTGRLSSGLRGLYSVREGGDAYAFTQFESIYARMAFPSFDEPGFKTPFETVLNVPRGQTAISNTPAVEAQPREDGLVRVRFARTRPLPTYLVAFAIGPLDVVDGPVIPPNDVRGRPLPLRGISARGKGGDFEFAFAHTGELLALLESYFGVPYPYAKLDILAVPDFSAGAMENAGAITFRENLLLLGEHAPATQRRSFATVMAHELAHQWFGNLVTMEWWDDLWLNEAFATWLAYRTVDEWNTAYEGELLRLERLFSAMDEDSLSTARQIRQPVTDSDGIVNAFDGITYSKGGAVLAMFEHYVGAEAFRDGVRDYLRRHADGNATADDFIAAIAGRSDEVVGEAFRSFLVQSGLPALDVKVDCDDAGPVLAIEQRRYLPLGSEASPDRRWSVPVCLHPGQDDAADMICFLNDRPRERFPLKSCPGWVMPNADFAGYYHWQLPAADYHALNEHAASLTAAEQLSVARSLSAAFFAGDLDTVQTFELLRPLAASPRPQVALAPAPFVQFVLEHLVLKPPAIDAARRQADTLYRRIHATQAFDPDFMAGLGRDSDRLFLADVASFEARWVRDAAVREEAAIRGRAYLGDGDAAHPEAVAPELLPLALEMAVQLGGRDVYEQVSRHFMRSRDALFRDTALKALARATDPAQARQTRSLALSDELRSNEIGTLLAEHFTEPANREAAWEWLEANIEPLIARMPPLHANRISEFAEGFCSEPRAAEVEEFLRPYIEPLRGGPRELAKSIERIRLCAATAAHQKPSAIAWLGE